MTATATPPVWLDFSLHDFVRVCWVSNAARELWNERFQRIAHAWVNTEVATVLHNYRRCALLATGARRHCALLNGLHVGTEPVSIPGHPTLCAVSAWSGGVLVGSQTDAEALLDAWRRGSSVDVGQLLGYPDCCRHAFAERCAAGFKDHTWSMAIETVRASPPQADVDGPPWTNLFWRSLGLRGIPHLPCSCTCAPSQAIGAAYATIASASGYATELEWCRHILSWPVKWTALHGIAEIKTPVLRLITNTEPTAQTLTVMWHGDEYPEHGAVGLTFPYRTRAARQRTAVQQPQDVRVIPLSPV